MNENRVTTSIKGNSKTEGVDSAGKLEEEVGYTSSSSPERDSAGHYIFDNPEIIDSSDKKCYAKKKLIKKNDGSENYKYYIKTGVEGFVFNPWGMFDEGTEGNYARNRGRSKWSFSEVNKKCFDFYIRFLQSRNKAWLSNAEREVQ